MEGLYPINNVAYHFIKKVHSDITIEKIIYSNKTFNNSDELKKDINNCKNIINCSKYTDVFITCCTLNFDYQQTTYLWGTNHANKKIYKFTLYNVMMCDEEKNTEEKKPNEDEEESKHDVIDDIKIVPKSSSTEEKKSDEIEQTNQSSESTDKDEEDEEQNSQSSESTKKRKPIPIYYNDKIVRYLLPGEDAPDNTESVFDEFNNIEKYILSHTCSEPIPVKMYGNIVRYILPGEKCPDLVTNFNSDGKIKYYFYDNTSMQIFNKNKSAIIILNNVCILYKLIPIYYNDKIVRYVLPGEDAPDNTEPVFDEYNNVLRFIISDDSIKDVSKQTKTKYTRHKLYISL